MVRGSPMLALGQAPNAQPHFVTAQGKSIQLFIGSISAGISDVLMNELLTVSA